MATASYAPLLETAETSLTMYITPADASKMVARLRNVSLFLRVQMFCYTVTPSDDDTPRGFDITETVNVNAAQVQKVLREKIRFADLKREKDGTELKVEVTRLGSCMFFG